MAGEVGDGFTGMGGSFVAVVFVYIAKVVSDALGLRCIGLEVVTASLGMSEVKVLRHAIDVEQCKMLLRLDISQLPAANLGAHIKRIVDDYEIETILIFVASDEAVLDIKVIVDAVAVFANVAVVGDCVGLGDVEAVLPLHHRHVVASRFVVYI